MNKIRAQRFYREVAEESPKGIKSDVEHYLMVLEAAYRKAQSHDIDHISEIEFADVYGDEIVNRDREHALALRTQFEESDARQLEKTDHTDPRRLSLILEVIIAEQIELNEWFGEGTNTIQTADYDDIENGVDAIVEFAMNEGRNHMGLAFDTTYASKKNAVSKLIRTVREIKAGKLGQLKYFRTTDGDLRGHMRNIPRVILSIDRENAILLAETWVEGKQEQLARHPIQLLLLHEIIMQLEGQINLAEHEGQDHLIRPLATQLAIAQRLLKEKTDQLSTNGTAPSLPRDSNFLDLKKMVERKYYPKNSLAQRPHPSNKS